MSCVLKFLSALIGMGLLAGCGDDFPVQPEATPEGGRRDGSNSNGRICDGYR